MIRALTVRHLVEQACTDLLRLLSRAYGPHPLAMDEEVALRYQELDLYLRQLHAERDLESLDKYFWIPGCREKAIHGFFSLQIVLLSRRMLDDQCIEQGDG
jgi:hypothetical protein